MLVTSSWFLIAALIAWVVAPRVDQVAPGLGGLKYVAGFAFAVILYLSVLLHEASHAYMARHYGYQVSSITLHFLGGATAIEGEARTPAPGADDRGRRARSPRSASGWPRWRSGS